jgi:hypothetical protein
MVIKMYYHEVDYYSYKYRKFFYGYISSLNHEYGIGVCWDKDKSPMYIIEKVELVCVDTGCYNPDFAYPPHYEPEGVETIIIRPKLKFPKR